MASIVQRRNGYTVVYYKMVDGQRKQKWEAYHTLEEAIRRKELVELCREKEQALGKANVQTVDELLMEYVSLYGKMRWSLSTYQSNTALIRQYTIPFMGSLRLSEISPRIVSVLYQRALHLPRHCDAFHKQQGTSITAATLKSMHKVLHSAFEQAVRWEYVKSNPFHGAELPRTRRKEQSCFTPEQLAALLADCDDERLNLAIQLAFSGTLRKGELLALTWEDVDFSAGSIHVNKTLCRLGKEAMRELKNRDILHQFPPVLPSENTALVLKLPKTQTSVRTVYLPDSVMQSLADWRTRQMELRKDPWLVFEYPDGRPYQETVLTDHFHAQLARSGLPRATFHSLRHSSITYKLILTGGNIKAVQGDSGHAQAEMVTEVYGHILERSRQENAVLFEKDFFQTQMFSKTRIVAAPDGNPNGGPSAFRRRKVFRFIGLWAKGDDRMTYNDILDSSDLIELSKRLKAFLASSPTETEIARLHAAAEELYLTVMKATLIVGQPSWYAATGRVAAVLYVYRNWVKQDCPGDDLRALKNLTAELESDILGETGTVLTEASIKKVMDYLNGKYNFSKCVLDDQFLFIFLIENRHRTQRAFCRQLAFGDGSTGRDIYLFGSSSEDEAPESILLHELGHVLNTKLTGSTKLVPESFFQMAEPYFPCLSTTRRSDGAEFFAHCFAMGVMVDTDFEKYDPFITILPEHKRVFNRYMEAMMARLKNE